MRTPFRLVAFVAAGFAIADAEEAKMPTASIATSRDFYAKVHFVAIASLDFGGGSKAQFKYDRYPEGGPERILAADGSFARKSAKAAWLRSDDWGDTGKPVDAQTAARLNNYVGLVQDRLKGEPSLEFVTQRTEGDRENWIYESKEGGAAGTARFTFGKYKDAKSDTPVLLSEFAAPMKLGARIAQVKISFSYLVSVKMVEAKDEAPAPKPEKAAADDASVKLLDGKFTLSLPPDFTRDPADPKNPKSLARFSCSREGGAWGEVLRGTHGLTPEKVPDYLKTRVAEYSKGFNWLPKDTPLTWLKKEMVTIDGRAWADWRYVPMKKGAKSYQTSPLYTRFLTTSYQGQLLEITFMTNLNTEPALKAEIDGIMSSIRLED
jgi:hypothetical protein